MSVRKRFFFLVFVAHAGSVNPANRRERASQFPPGYKDEQCRFHEGILSETESFIFWLLPLLSQTCYVR